MKPLSSLKYFSQNKKRLATVFTVLVLSVLVVSFITSIITSIILDATKTNLDVLKNMSYIYPASNKVFLDDDVVEKVKNYNEVKDIFNVSITNTVLNTIVGTTSSPVIISESANDIQTMINEMGLTLIDGRLPSGNDFEIVLHERLLQNKGLKIGDYIGSDVDENEWLQGKYKIVGVLRGDAITSFANKNSYMESLKDSGMVFNKSTGQVLIPNENQINEMNQKLESLNKKDVGYQTFNSLQKNLDMQLSSLNTILFIVVFTVVCIIAVSISAMIYIVYMNRSEEFGILHAIGYRKTFISSLILKEISMLSIVSWIVGYLASWGVLSLVNYLILSKKGQILYFFTELGVINTLVIPVMIIIFAIVPLLRKLKKWDPISVIERRE